MKRLFFLGFVSLSLLACGRPFDVKTAPGFVELQNQEPTYSFRATTPEGVVMAVQVQDSDPSRGADLDFWVRAVTLQMRDVQGYALLEAKDVVSRDGTKGKQLRFGHDEANKPFSYWLTVFVAQDRVFLVEAGGSKVQFDRYTASLEWMHKSVRVKCNSWLSPVLASRTCNRW